MKGKHIIQAVNFNNGEALDLQTLNERLKSNKLENSELISIVGGCSCDVRCSAKHDCDRVRSCYGECTDSCGQKW